MFGKNINLFILMTSLIMLSGCDGDAILVEKEQKDDEVVVEDESEIGDKGRFVYFGGNPITGSALNPSHNMHVVVDSETNCKYLVYHNEVGYAGQGGLTPLYKEDGSIDCD